MKSFFLSMTIFFIFICKTFAGFIVCHNGSGVIVEPSSSTAICVNYAIPPFSVTDYDRVRTVWKTITRKYIKWTTEPVEMTQGEKDAVDAAELVQIDATLRVDSKAQFDGQTITGQSLRCLSDIIKKEINLLRQWNDDFKTETAAATNLADFQTRIATLPSMPDRTLSQLKTQIQACIDNGDVDE